jgi:hypothetical protein
LNFGCEIIYIDECTCNPWNKDIKMWVNRDDPFHLDLAPDRKDERGSVAVLGAISNKQREFKWIASSLGNRAETF